MPYRLIGADIKQRALWLLAEDYLPDEVHIILDVSNHSMQRWTANLAGYGHVIPPHNPLQGQPRGLIAMHTYSLIDTIKSFPAIYLDELQDWLALKHDILISKSALNENIREVGLSYKLLCQRAAEWNEAVREEWKADVCTNFVVRQMVWTDELSKDDWKIYGHYG
jgi:transposase